MKVTYGADPEFFVQEIKTGQIVPACGLFGGAKRAPIFLSNNGGYLEDGVSIEFNVRPTDSIPKLAESLTELMALWEVKHPGYLLVPMVAAHDFGARELRRHPQALILGCEADMWYYGIRKMPQANEMGGMRFTGGHLHLGFEDLPEPWIAEDIIPILDMEILGQSIKRANNKRWKFYGHHGIYRTTPYGVEYRSPDNWWVTPKEHPLVTKDQYERIKQLIEEWQKILYETFSLIEKNPEVAWNNTKQHIMAYNILDYCGSNKSIIDPGYSKNLYDYGCLYINDLRRTIK